MTSQADQVILYLESGYELTPLQALTMFNCFRLAARIKDLRKRGYAIETLERRSGEKRFAAYRLSRPIQHNLFDLTSSTATGSGFRAGTLGGSIL